jgi:hypothetical protein
MLATLLASHSGPRGILFDRPHVVQDASALLDAKGVSNRVTIEPGNFFESVPAGGGDACILSHILHDWNEDQCLTILDHVRKAMNSAGRLLIVEMVIPPGDAPHPGKMLDMAMLVQMGGQERTADEYELLLSKGGFRLTPSGTHQVSGKHFGSCHCLSGGDHLGLTTAVGHEPSFGQAAQFLLSPRADTRCAGLHHPLHRAGLGDAPARQSSSPGRMPTGRNRSRSTRSAGVKYSRLSVHLNRAAAGPAILNNPARGRGSSREIFRKTSGRVPYCLFMQTTRPTRSAHHPAHQQA